MPLEAPVRIALVSLLLLSSSPAVAALVPIFDDTNIRIGCSGTFISEGVGHAWPTQVIDVRNPNPGQSFSAAGSLCGIDFSISMTIDRDAGAITFERTIVDTWNGVAPVDMIRSVGGWFAVAFESDGEPFWYHDGISYDPACEQAPCAPLWDLRTSFEVLHRVEFSPTAGDPFLMREFDSLTVRYTPEPGTAALLALGLTAAALPRWRRDSRATSGSGPASDSGAGPNSGRP